jgi:hypothetical protein
MPSSFADLTHACYISSNIFQFLQMWRASLSQPRFDILLKRYDYVITVSRIYLSIHHLISLSLCLFVSLSLCLFVSLSLCLFVSLSLCLFVSLCLSLSPSLSLSIHVYLSVYLYLLPCLSPSVSIGCASLSLGFRIFSEPNTLPYLSFEAKPLASSTTFRQTH